MFQPSEDRILVKPITGPDKTSGGLHIPETAKAPPTKGIVVAVGPGAACRHCGLPNEPKVEVGWTVLFPENAGLEIMVNGEPHKVIRFLDIQLYDDNVQPVEELPETMKE